MITMKDVEYTDELDRLQKKYESTFEEWRIAWENKNPIEAELEIKYKKEVDDWNKKYSEYCKYVRDKRP